MKLFNIIIINIVTISLNLIISNGFAINPTSDYVLTPDSLGLKFKNKIIKTKDGYNLSSWQINPSINNENNKKVIIFASSDAGNMSYYLYHANALANSGYNIIMFDYRGFGKSSSFNYDKNMLYYDEYVLDLLAVIDEVKEEFKDKKIGIMGFSMGTIIANIAIQKRNIDFVINEGLIQDLNAYSEKIFEMKSKKIKLPKSAKRYNKTFFSTVHKQVNYFVFVGKKDSFSFIDIDMIKKQGATIFEFNGGHLGAFNTLSIKKYGDEYLKIINNYLISL